MKLKLLHNFAVCSIAHLLLVSCEGVFSGLYDEMTDRPTNAGGQTTFTEGEVKSVEGRIYVDAGSWSTWNYIDFDVLLAAAQDATVDVESAITVMDIPTEASQTDSPNRIYTYWFDVFGKGLSHYELRASRATDAQPEPDGWTIALHRETVRTNGCAVMETQCTSFDELPASSAAFDAAAFECDSWSERDVWVEQGQMLLGLIGCQGIYINKVLSNWYTCNIPPMPPTYTMNNHVFIMRLPNGKCAALQLANHLSASGTKCCFTINYKYPY